MAAEADNTGGQFTTAKLQSLLKARTNPAVGSRQQLVDALHARGISISLHGVAAWFRRVDSNYNQPRESLSPIAPSYALPDRHWRALCELFDIPMDRLTLSDAEFERHCLSEQAQNTEPRPVRAFDATPADSLPGRERVWSTLAEALLGVVAEEEQNSEQEKRARVVLLEGAAGLGKTSLVRLLAERAGAAGITCLSASCEDAQEIPFLPLLDLLRFKMADVARHGELPLRLAEEIVAVLDGSAATADSRDLFLKGTRLLAEIAATGPVIVVVDDMHWVDVGTRRLVVYLSRYLQLHAHLPVLMVLASRQFDGAFLHQLPTDDLRERIALTPLVRSDARRLLARALGTRPGPKLLEFADSVTEGSPLYLQLLAEHLLAQEQLETRGATIELTTAVEQIGLPETLDGFYTARFRDLPPKPAELIELMACVGRRSNGEFLQLLSQGDSIETVLKALDTAEQQGLLRLRNEQFEFTHSMARHGIYASIPEARRARLHADIAERVDATLLGRSHHAIIELAYHRVRGRPYTDTAQTLAACLSAARMTYASNAWPTVEFFANAGLEIDETSSGLTESERGELLRLRATSQHQTGRPEAALRNLDAALDEFRISQNTLEYARALNDVVRIRTNFGAEREAVSEAAAELEARVESISATDRDLAAFMLDTVATFHLVNRDSHGALQISQRYLDAYGDELDSKRLALGRATAGFAGLQHLDVHGAIDNLTEATRLARRHDDRPTTARALQRLAIAQVMLGRLEDVRTTFAELRDMGDAAMLTGEFSIPCLAAGQAEFIRGDAARAGELVEEGLDQAHASGYWHMESSLLSLQAALALTTDSHEGYAAALRALEGDRPSRTAASLRAFARARFDTDAATTAAERPTTQASGMSTESALSAPEFARLTLITDAALAADDLQTQRAAVERLTPLAEAGVMFPLGVPLLLPELLARLQRSLGAPDEARYQQRRAQEFARQNRLRPDTPAAKLWPGLFESV
ncbi:MAG: AAA family ATPase [Pseudomonadota bacterium]